VRKAAEIMLQMLGATIQMLGATIQKFNRADDPASKIFVPLLNLFFELGFTKTNQSKAP
jgi:hypothetical protein